MSFQDVLNVAIVVILVYLCLSGLIGRICKAVEMSKNCDNGAVNDIFEEMTKMLKK